MPLIILPDRRIRQPQDGAIVRLSDYFLSKQPSLLWSATLPSKYVINRLTSSAISVTSGARHVNKEGIGYREFYGTSLIAPVSSYWPSTSTLVTYCRVISKAGSGFDTVFGFNNVTGDVVRIGLSAFVWQGKAQRNFSGLTINQAFPDNANPTVDREYLIALRSNSATSHALIVYDLTTGATSTTTDSTDISSVSYIDSMYPSIGGESVHVTSVYWGAKFDVALLDADLLALARNPWSLFKPDRRISYFTVATGGINGTFNATETGTDTFAATGTVLVSGTLAATETGTDSLSATGTVLVSGALAATETGTDVFTATGTTVACTYPTVAATAGGSGAVSGSFNVSVPGSSAASGDLLILAIAADSATVNISSSDFTQLSHDAGGSSVLYLGYRICTGSEGATLTAATDASEAYAYSIYKISAATWHGSEVPDVGTAATGTSSTPNPPSVTAGWGQACNTFIAAVSSDDGRSTVSAGVSGYDNFITSNEAGPGGVNSALCSEESETASLDPGTFTLSGSQDWVTQTVVVRPPTGGGIQGTFNATETGTDAFAATGAVLVSGTIAATETGADVFAATGAVLVSGSLAATETGADTLAATGGVLVSGALAATETGADTLAATGAVLVSGALAATETGTDTFSASGTTTGAIQGSFHAAETGADTFAATGSVLVSGSIAATETGADTFSATGSTVTAAELPSQVYNWDNELRKQRLAQDDRELLELIEIMMLADLI